MHQEKRRRGFESGCVSISVGAADAWRKKAGGWRGYTFRRRASRSGKRKPAGLVSSGREPLVVTVGEQGGEIRFRGAGSEIGDVAELIDGRGRQRYFHGRMLYGPGGTQRSRRLRRTELP